MRRKRTTHLSSCTKNNKKTRLRRKLEDPKAREERLAQNRARNALRKSLESEEARNERLAKTRDYNNRLKKCEKPEDRSARLYKSRSYHAYQRLIETPEVRSQRLTKDRESKAKAKSGESLEAWRTRLAKERECVAAARALRKSEIQQAKRGAQSQNKTRKPAKEKTRKDVDDTFETQPSEATASDEFLQSYEVIKEEEDPLTLPGPSYKCVTVNNVKIELEESESQSDIEEWQANVEFKTEVKEELDVEEYGETSGQYANADDEELLEVESVPKEQVFVKREAISPTESGEKRRRN